MAGWIRLSRNLLDCWLWQEKPFSKAQAWVDILLLANYETKTININEYPVDVIKAYNVKKSKDPLYIYMLWLEYAEDKKTFADKYCRPKRIRRS